MELNLNIVGERLPDIYEKEWFGSTNLNRTLKYPLIYEKGTALLKDLLYVCRSETLTNTSPVPGISAICIGEIPPPDWCLRCHILWIRNDISLFFLFHEIAKIFDEFNRIEYAIIEEMTRDSGPDIKRILYTIAAILENPVNVTNATLMSLFAMTLTPLEDTKKSILPFNISIMQHKRLIEPLDGIKEIHIKERLIREPYFSSGTMDGKKCYCRNLFLYERFVGCIYFNEDYRSFKRSDITIADYFFDLFENAFGKYIQYTPNIEPESGAAIKKLLKDAALTKTEAAALEIGESECCYSFTLRPSSNVSQLPLESMCATLNVLLSGIVTAVLYEEKIIGLLKLDTKDPARSSLSYFEAFTMKMGYTVGISRPYSDIALTRTYLSFARYALECGSENDEGVSVFYFEDYILNYIIVKYHGQFPAHYLFPRGLLALIEHDTDSDVSYIDTLDNYLRHNMSIQKTSDALFLHRSSLINRLERINRLLQMNLEESEVRLYLELCLYIMTR